MLRTLQIVTAAAALAGLAGASAAADRASASIPAITADSASASSAGNQPEVTVRARRARRAELAPKVSAFVNHIASLENGEGLARWQARVCPLVTGLVREDGEFILGRVSEIARTAGVPLGDEHCRPNLFILVTRQPGELLKGLEKRHRVIAFGDAAPSVVEEFIATPRPVRVWYNSSEVSPEGVPFTRPTAPDAPLYNNWAQATHLTLNAIWTFSNVFIVIDRTRLQTVSREQLADYVAMVGLAQIKPAAHLGDAETILRLFDSPSRAAPAGMSDWDRAFLKSLYGTDQQLRLQRNQIARRMVREIIP